MTHRATAVLIGLLLVLGLAAPVAAAEDTPPADEQVGDQVADQLGGASLVLTGPGQAAVGDIVDLTLTASDATALEAVVEYDRAALDFGGLYQNDGSTQFLSVTNQPDRVAIAAYGCATTDCQAGAPSPVGAITIRFSVLEAGTHRIGLSRAVVVSGSGDVANPADQAVELSVAGADAVTSGGAGPVLNGDRDPVEAGAADLTGDDAVTAVDVTEVAQGWTEVRRRGEPCALESERLQAVDADGSGCIDVADVAGVARLVTTNPGPRQPLDGAAAANDPAAPTPMVVNSTSDEWDANLNNGICNTPSGVCSLRAAILQANRNPGPDIIHFNIPGNGPHRINLGDQLPTINDTSGTLTIDGYTEPGATANTSERLSNASIEVEVYGRGYNGYSSLVITSPNNTVRGLSFYRAFSNIRITGSNATGNRIVGNFIGTNAAGSYHVPGARNEYIDQAGVEIVSGASNNRIGTPDLADRNVISGNPYSGVRINHAATKGNLVQNNLIGFNPNGTDTLWTYVAGVDVQWGANESLVGGYQEHAGNAIGGIIYGVDLSHSSKNNRVVGNYLGTDVTGSRVRSDTGNRDGLAIKDNTVGNLIEHNVIGGNTRTGIWHRHNFTGGNTFRHNRVGVGVDGSDVGNNGYGMDLSGHDDTYEQNIFANNSSTGVRITNYNGGNGFSPPEYTQRNRLSNNSFYDNGNGSISVSGAHNNIRSPRITSYQTGSVSGTACGGCRVELYAYRGGARQFMAATTASSGGNWSISDGAIANNRFSAVAISGNNDTSQFTSVVSVGSRPGNTAPTVSPIGDRNSGRYQLTTIRTSASDPNGNYLTYSALGMPAGVTINSRTGVISGRPGSLGRHKVHVRVDDGAAATQTSFTWTVGTPNQAPTINPIGNQSGTVGQGVSLTATGSDPEGGTLTFSATGLPNGLSINNSGRISGTLSQAGSFSVTVTATDPAGARAATSFNWTVTQAGGGFTCSVDGNTLSWSNQGASRYYIRQLHNNVDRYVGSSSGLSYQLANPAGTYTVRYWSGPNPIDTTCDAPAGGGFSCSVDGNTLSWNDQGASRYYIRQLHNNVDRYVGSSSGLSYQLTNPAGTYTVRYWPGGAPVDATCSP